MPVDPLEQLEQNWVALPDKPEETPAGTLAALRRIADGDDVLLADLVARRIAGVPLAHLTGRQTFLGIEMLAGPEALIPRVETEILARGALNLVRGIVKAQGSARVLDVCCGSGNIALALAWHEPECEVAGADISEAAVELARRNATMLGLEGRVAFLTSDLFASVIGAFELITCNPPYISSGRVDKMHREISAFEPRLAFDGGPFGIRILTRLIREAPAFLKPGGWLAFETGAGQGDPMVKMMRTSPAFVEVEPLTDQNGETRAVLGRTAPASV